MFLYVESYLQLEPLLEVPYHRKPPTNWEPDLDFVPGK